MIINCIIVDDDPIVLSLLQDFALQTPFLNLVAACSKAADALKLLEKENIQLMFLDIHMPDINGMTLAKTLHAHYLQKAPRVVFISGSKEFALESYKVDALDYLLKPVSYEDFFKAAYKAKLYFEGIENPVKNEIQLPLRDFVVLKVDHELIRVQLNNILYIEGDKDYVKVYINENNFIKALTTMKDIEKRLPKTSFMRVHRSFIISLDKIVAIQNYTVRIGKISIQVKEQYKSDFKGVLEQWLK
nr:LytTR family DNA-binding domain-containing protein [Mucilaginibacter sp. L294]